LIAQLGTNTATTVNNVTTTVNNTISNPLTSPNALSQLLAPIANILQSVVNTLQGLFNALDVSSLSLSIPLPVCDLAVVNAAATTLVGSLTQLQNTLTILKTSLRKPSESLLN
jgi:hypothetical protein